MKKQTLTLLLAFICAFAFAQKVIENPDFGFANLPGAITKIERLDTTTVLHFRIKTSPGSWMSIPKKTFIQDVDGGDKLFVTKTEGIPLAERYFMPKSGEVNYKLFFPRLNKNAASIDYGEANDGGNWFVYDIVINEDENVSLLPKELRGNWLLADGSNRFDYGFNMKNAIVEGAIWDYKSVDKKGKKYTILIENEAGLKTIHAKLGKHDEVAFGNTAKSLKWYSLTKVFNPNFGLQEDPEFENIAFSLDSTTYSGAINGFSDKVKQKTGMVYVNNAFTGSQESHLVKINEDGSFHSTFPLTHPQTVFVKMASGAYTVFLEPNKEVFHYLHGKTSFFMRDNAQVNADLDALKDIRLSFGMEEMRKVGETSPKDYKKMFFNLSESALNELTAYKKNNFVSQKALQIKNLDLELNFYQELLGYDMYRSSVQYQNKRAEKEEDKIPYQEFEVNESYYDFLPKDVAENRLFALSNEYYFFVNRLIYADVFKANPPSKLTKVEKNNSLQNKVVELAARDKNIKAFFGKENAFLFDVIKMEELCKPFADFEVYSDETLINAQNKVNIPFLKNYLAVSNEQIKEKIQINKTKGGYTIHNVEKNEGDELFDVMIEKFKGKVVYVDFWATWCGPCKSGITRIAPLKEEMKDEDVVFLYVTNQTSPEGTWKNSIPNIKGEHYRVSADEWNYLADKFQISGIPHYTLVNKKGEVVKPKMGHLSNDRLMSVLKSEMEK